MAEQQTSTGLPRTDQQRFHFDVYAILEAPQELYFGHEAQVNVNLVETVNVPTQNGTLEKCYLSPTKRRGVERRSLIWAPVQAEGILLGDKQNCGIPETCAQPDCPICAIYGGLIPGKLTTVGRLIHGGGVAIQDLEPSEKQRAMHPSMLHKEPGEKPTPTPFKREYNQPALLYPVYNHCMSVTEAEFAAAAYAFLDSHVRLGAGNPKGVRIHEADMLGAQQPLLVLDRYLTPVGKRPVLSPQECDSRKAIDKFCTAALTVRGETQLEEHVTFAHEDRMMFERWVGNTALRELQNRAVQFAATHL